MASAESSDSDSEMPKETVIIVHGTWAGPTEGQVQWYEPKQEERAQGSFVTKLDEALEGRRSGARCWAHCNKDCAAPFSWPPGENNWIARANAATALAKYVNKLQLDGWLCHIVAHSHGGNIAVEALPQIRPSPRADGRLSKIVTLGTPFMNVLSPIREQADRKVTIINKAPVLAVGVFTAIFILAMILVERPLSFATLKAIRIIIIAYCSGFAVDIFLQWRKKHKIGDGNASGRSKVALLAIGCDTDEVWQVLNYLRESKNPLLKLNLPKYLTLSIRSAIFRAKQVASILGAKSFKDIKEEKALPAIILSLFFIVSLFDIISYIIFHIAGAPPPRSTFNLMMSLLPTDAHKETSCDICSRLVNFSFVGFLVLVSGRLAGTEFFSAFWSPFRLCIQIVAAFAGAGAALGHYLVRYWSWPVFVRQAMGLESYGLDLPPVTQRPQESGALSVTDEKMPPAAEDRAISNRTDWISRHLASVSDTFAKLVVTSDDLEKLLRTFASNQKLVHAAYYTDPECIGRIADWIAAPERPPDRQILLNVDPN